MMHTGNKPWTHKEAMFAIEKYGALKGEDIAKILGRSRRAVIGFIDRYKKTGKLPTSAEVKTYSLIELRNNQCRWMQDGQYCCNNDMQKDKRSYCKQHHYKIYRKNEKK